MLPEQLIILLISLGVFFLLLGIGITYLIIKHNNRLNRMFFEKHQLLNESRRMSIEEGERMMLQISREVHDNIGHAATFATIKLNRAKQLATDDNMKLLLEDIVTHVDGIAKESTNISHSVNHNYIKAKNLHLLLGDDLEHIRLYRNITYDMVVRGSVKTLIPETKLLVYRIAQQAFSNILKHSGATQINLLLQYSEDSFKMSIADNGTGLTPEQLHNRNGIGITNMMERAELLGSKLIIDATPGGGCTITLWIPEITFLESNIE